MIIIEINFCEKYIQLVLQLALHRSMLIPENRMPSPIQGEGSAPAHDNDDDDDGGASVERA